MLQVSYYLLKVLLCSGILLGYYWCMLRNKIYHHYNRFFLLVSVLLALTLPLLEIHIWHYADEPKSQAIQLLQAVTSSDDYINDMAVNTMPEYFTLSQLLTVAYFIVTMVLLVMFIRVLWIIRTLIYKYRGQVVERFFFINTNAKGTPFSFLNYIFWNEAIDPDSTTGRQIFRHEVAHVQEKHSYDKLFINAVLIFFWCNPFFWLLRKELNMIHEFIADKKAVEDSDTASFAAMILQAAYPRHRFELTNNFFYSPIKRRLLMLTKNQNPKVSYFSRILVLPLAVLVFAAFSFKAKTIGLPQQDAPITGKPLTVVIDAGHGGNDAGGFGKDGVSEKDMSLAIVQKIKELNNSANINIVLTRSANVTMNPKERVEFAKAQKADLFISIHLNSVTAGESESKNGMLVYIAKDEFTNANASRLFASALIGEFKNNYGLAVPANPMQRKTGIWVLQANECPSVLIEAGYITNEKDLAYLRTDAAKETIARNILAAINNYATQKNTVKAAVADTLPEVVVVGKQQTEDKKVVQVNDLDSIKPNDIYSIDIRRTNDVPGNGKNIMTIKVKPGQYAPAKEAQPLYVLDGKIIDRAEMGDLKADIIGHINVLKGDKAVTQYGEKGKNGVIEMFSKTYRKNEPVIDLIPSPGSNILYVGVDNPLRIEMPGANASDIKVAIDNGASIDERNGRYIARVTHPGNVTVYAYNKSGAMLYSKSFIVKLLPEPTRINASMPGETDMPKEGGNNVFIKVEQEAQFPGGADGWRKYLARSLDAKIAVSEGWKKGTYKVVVQFITDEDGNISDVTALNYKDSKTAAACVNIIKNGPRWIPAMQNGYKVKAYRHQPVIFIIEE
jgi:N-acetylmuramoyl-L-alanine amidase